MPSPQKSIVWPPSEDELWEEILEACAEQSEKEHRRVSYSEWLREAARQRLNRIRKS